MFYSNITLPGLRRIQDSAFSGVIVSGFINNLHVIYEPQPQKTTTGNVIDGEILKEVRKRLTQIQVDDGLHMAVVHLESSYNPTMILAEWSACSVRRSSSIEIFTAKSPKKSNIAWCQYSVADGRCCIQRVEILDCEPEANEDILAITLDADYTKWIRTGTYDDFRRMVDNFVESLKKESIWVRT
jgi:hypothetical protein